MSNQNSVKVEVLTGEFVVPESVAAPHFLQSTTLGDSVGGEVVVYSELSKNIKSFSVRDDLVLVETDGEHNVGVNSFVDVEVTPDEDTTTTRYYVRKRFYQEITLKTPSYNSVIKDTGVGRGDLLNGGLDYTANTYTDVELIFLDQSQVRNGIGSAETITTLERQSLLAILMEQGMVVFLILLLPPKDLGISRAMY